MAYKPPKRNGRNSLNQEFIGRHMCNHYRRILNAKKVIDTSPPISYKTRLPAKKSSLTNSINKPKENRHLSPALTDRSLSVNSYKASSCGTESLASSSRYHTKCVPREPSLASSRKQALLDMNLIDRITYDTKNGPSAYCDEIWMEMKEQPSGKKLNVAFDVSTHKKEIAVSTSKQHAPIKNPCKSNERPTFRTQRKSSKEMNKQTDSYNSFGPKTRPRVLKTEAVSKLRSLRVYYPPRRKKKRETENYWDESNEKTQHVEDSNSLDVCCCSSNQVHCKKTANVVKEQTSSRDSAYNGGVSSLPESRSPTPDQRNKAVCVCGAPLEVQTKEREIWNYINKGEVKRAENATQADVSQEEIKPEEDEAFKKMKEDTLYVKFIQDITVEVLEKGLFTNKAIKKVMRKHILNNMQTLEKTRMLKEVENLRIQLGVPEDKSLLQVEDINEDSSGCLFKVYSVISDSAFTLPENLRENPTETTECSTGESQVLQTTEEKCDCVSELGLTNQAAKKLRERMRSADSSSEEGNTNRKKRPKVSKFAKVINGSPGSVCSSSSSSSECEPVYKTWEREHQKHRIVKKLRNSACTCDDKRNRSVSFDRVDVGRQCDKKHVPLILCVNHCQNDARKMKAKND